MKVRLKDDLAGDPSIICTLAPTRHGNTGWEGRFTRDVEAESGPNVS